MKYQNICNHYVQGTEAEEESPETLILFHLTPRRATAKQNLVATNFPVKVYCMLS